MTARGRTRLQRITDQHAALRGKCRKCHVPWPCAVLLEFQRAERERAAAERERRVNT